MRLSKYIIASLAIALAMGCGMEPEPDGRGEMTGYRTGTVDDDYTSNGERGNVSISEINWAGSVRNGDFSHDPNDIFIEMQNKHPRPIFLKGWLLTVEAGFNADGLRQAPSYRDRAKRTYVLPPRENGRPMETNEFIIIAKKRDGAFANADFFIEDLEIPDGPFEMTLQDLDERLIDHIGDDRKLPFAGAWDGVTARSMERIQLIFNNRGNRDSAWHSYSLNDFDDGRRGEFHQMLRQRIDANYLQRTFATPGMPNSPDYSGNISSGTFE
ncbi:MAG: hypothetical protein CMH52_08845 [Myxococcales bacterium]|nr:hypothetical protein [Myxococcales bacterium]